MSLLVLRDKWKSHTSRLRKDCLSNRQWPKYWSCGGFERDEEEHLGRAVLWVYHAHLPDYFTSIYLLCRELGEYKTGHQRRQSSCVLERLDTFEFDRCAGSNELTAAINDTGFLYMLCCRILDEWPAFPWTKRGTIFGDFALKVSVLHHGNPALNVSYSTEIQQRGPRTDYKMQRVMKCPGKALDDEWKKTKNRNRHIEK